MVWSTGEFGTILVNLFKPGTAAQFHYLQDSRTGGVTAKKYGFEVTHKNSHWEVKFGSQRYAPGYTGNVWNWRPTTGTSGWAARSHISCRWHSENVVCRQALCARNAIDFRNYKKFEGQSTITFGDAK
jgi:hypothetical protein